MDYVLSADKAGLVPGPPLGRWDEVLAGPQLLVLSLQTLGHAPSVTAGSRCPQEVCGPSVPLHS